MEKESSKLQTAPGPGAQVSMEMRLAIWKRSDLVESAVVVVAHRQKQGKICSDYWKDLIVLKITRKSRLVFT